MWIAGLFGPPPRPGRESVGWASVLFFGLAAVMGVRRLFDRGDQIVVDANGLFWKQYGSALRWSEIGRIEARSIKRQRFLCIFLKEPSRRPAVGWTGALLAANRGFGFGDLALSTTGTDRSHGELVDAVRHHAPADLLDI